MSILNNQCKVKYNNIEIGFLDERGGYYDTKESRIAYICIEAG